MLSGAKGKIKGDDPRTKMRNRMREGNAECSAKFSGDSEKKLHCRGYVNQCAKQEHAGRNEFKLESTKGNIEFASDFNECVDMATFMTAHAEDWGGPAKMKIDKKKVVKVVKAKVDHVRLAEASAYRMVGVTDKKAQVYFVDGGEDLVFVNGFELEEAHPGFASTTSPEDFIARLSAVKVIEGEKGKKEIQIEKLEESDEGVQTFLAKWGLPTLQNIHPEKLEVFTKSLKGEISKLAAFVDADDDNNILKTYNGIMDMAKAIYLDTSLEVVDESWSGPLPSIILNAMGDKKDVLPLVMARFHSKMGETVKMDDSLRACFKINPELNRRFVKDLRQKGYGNATKKVLVAAEEEAKKENVTSDILMHAVRRVESYLITESLKFKIDDMPEKIFSQDDNIFGNVKIDDIMIRLSQIRGRACVLKAEEFLAEAEDDGSNLDAILAKVEELPEQFRVGNSDDVLAEIADRVKSTKIRIHSKGVNEAIVLAREKIDAEATNEARLKDEWLTNIDYYLDLAITRAKNADVFEHFEKTIRILRDNAYRSKVTTAIAVGEAQLPTTVGGRFKSSDDNWLDQALKFVSIGRNTLEKGKLADSELKDGLKKDIEAFYNKACRTRAVQLIDDAAEQLQYADKSGWDWFGKLSGKIESAKNLMAKKGVGDIEYNSDKTLMQKADEILASAFKKRIDKSIKNVETAIAKMEYPSKENYRDIRVALNAVYEDAVAVGMKKESIQDLIIPIYRRALTKGIDYIITKTDAVLLAKVGDDTIQENWQKDISEDLSRATELLNTEYKDWGKVYAFEDSDGEGKQHAKKINEFSRKMILTEARRWLRLGAKHESNRTNGNTEWVVQMNMELDQALDNAVLGHAASPLITEIRSCRTQGHLYILDGLIREAKLQERYDYLEEAKKYLGTAPKGNMHIVKNAVLEAGEWMMVEEPVLNSNIVMGYMVKIDAAKDAVDKAKGKKTEKPKKVDQNEAPVEPMKRDKDEARAARMSKSDGDESRVKEEAKKLHVIATHPVEDGDTLAGLAEKYNTTVRNLQECNGLGDSVTIKKGKTINVCK